MGAWRRGDVTTEQAAHGVRELITADSFDEQQAIAQRIKAPWYA